MTGKNDILLGFILATKLRTNIISILADGPKKPIDIIRQLDIERSNASVIFNNLEGKGLIRNITKNKTWKVISLTERGEQLSNRLQN